MPTLPILLARQSSPKTKLNGTAIAFLVPLFVIFVFGPFFCIYLVNNRRRSTNQAPPITLKYRAPTQKREEVKQKLEGVTKVVSSVTSGDGKNKGANVETVERKASIDGASIAEKDCAICLSTLHAPSPPEPAKVATTQGTIVLEPAPLADVSSPNDEEILRLKICGHEFHAECLVSWSLRKWSCPICRALYFAQLPSERSSSADARLETIEESNGERTELEDQRRRSREDV